MAPAKLPFTRHIDHGAAAPRRQPWEMFCGTHELLVADENSPARPPATGYAVTGYLLRVRDPVHIQRLSIRLPDGGGDRVGGVALAQSCQTQEALPLVKPSAGMDLSHT